MGAIATILGHGWVGTWTELPRCGSGRHGATAQNGGLHILGVSGGQVVWWTGPDSIIVRRDRLVQIIGKESQGMIDSSIPESIPLIPESFPNIHSVPPL